MVVHNTHIFFHITRLILIAEKDTVYEKFPTPLINRMEKHFVLTSSVLEDWQETVLDQLEKWISQFCNTGFVLCVCVLSNNVNAAVFGLTAQNVHGIVGTCMM